MTTPGELVSGPVMLHERQAIAAPPSKVKEVLLEIAVPNGHTQDVLLDKLASVIGMSSEGPAEVFGSPGSLKLLAKCLCSKDARVSDAAVSVFALLAQNMDSGTLEALHRHEGASKALLKVSGAATGAAICTQSLLRKPTDNDS